MARKYKPQHTYFDSHPEIVKIFDDLDELLDFCRMNWMAYNPEDLYNKESYVWRAFEKSKGIVNPRPRYPRARSA